MNTLQDRIRGSLIGGAIGNPNTGQIITLAKYGEITMISKDLIRAEVNDLNIESVLLNRNGNEIEQVIKE